VVKPSEMDASTTPARRCCWLSWALLLVAAPTTMVAPRVAEGNGSLSHCWKKMLVAHGRRGG